MSHTADVTQKHKPRSAEEIKAEKTIDRIPPGKGARSLWVFGEFATHKVPSQRTGGAYALFEVATPPGAGPPPHIHHREDEAFYLLEGKYEFIMDGRTFEAEVGTLIYVPKGALHAHRNLGEGVGRMLLTQTPGGLYELFFEKAGKPAVDDGGVLPPTFRGWPEAGRRIVEVAAEHGTEIPPPLAKKDRQIGTI